MRNYQFLTLFCLAIILFGCTRNDMNGKWIYSLEYGGMVYSGMIYDFENLPNTRYSLLSKNYCDTISLKDSELFLDTTRIGTIVWKNNNCIVIKGLRDSLVFHKVPDLQLADSKTSVLSFLTSQPILYKDNFYKLNYYFDTTINERDFYHSSFRNLNYPQYGLEYSSWKLETVNNSIILLNQDPFSLFPKNLLITNITNDSISGIILGFPENIRDSIIRAISSQKNLEFEYEKFSLKKVKTKTKAEITLLKETLTSKKWKLSIIDSTYLSYGRIHPREKARIFPQRLDGLEYKFSIDNNYEIATKDSTYKGKFDLSIDGKYIILDNEMYYDNCIEILELDSLLKMNQIIKIHDSERKYRTYDCKIELK